MGIAGHRAIPQNFTMQAHLHLCCAIAPLSMVSRWWQGSLLKEEPHCGDGTNRKLIQLNAVLISPRTPVNASGNNLDQTWPCPQLPLTTCRSLNSWSQCNRGRCCCKGNRASRSEQEEVDWGMIWPTVLFHCKWWPGNSVRKEETLGMYRIRY